MRFSELAKITRVFNEGKNGTAGTVVIVPVYKEYECLLETLRLLSAQTRQDFDVLLVLSSISDAESACREIAAKKPSFKVIVSQRIGETGSAGGFFAGQVYALENKYDYMVLADVDCYPVDRHLFEELSKNKGNCIVLPKIRLLGPPGGPEDYGRTIPGYGMLPGSIARNIGLVYAPFYNAGEDPEYYARAQKAGIEFVHIENLATHPNGVYQKLPYVFTRPHYILHALLINRTTPNVWVHVLSMLEGAVFFAEPFGGKMRAMLGLAVGFRYGKEAADALRIDIEKCLLEKSALPADAVVLNLGHGRSLSPTIRKEGYSYLAKNIFTIPFKYFRKKVTIRETNSYRVLALTSVFAKELYYQVHNGRCVLVARHDSFVLHSLQIAAFFLLSPFYLLLFIPTFLLMKKMRFPKTSSFGIEG